MEALTKPAGSGRDACRGDISGRKKKTRRRAPVLRGLTGGKLVRAPPWGPGLALKSPAGSAPGPPGQSHRAQRALPRASSFGRPCSSPGTSSQPRSGVGTLPLRPPGYSYPPADTANPHVGRGLHSGSWWAQPSLSSPVCRTGGLLPDHSSPQRLWLQSSCPVGHKRIHDLLKPSDAKADGTVVSGVSQSPQPDAEPDLRRARPVSTEPQEGFTEVTAEVGWPRLEDSLRSSISWRSPPVAPGQADSGTAPARPTSL